MLNIRNLRIERVEGWSRLTVDIRSDFEREDAESTMWIAVEEKNEYMLTKDVYNAFLILPTYMAMYYHTDLNIDGFVSKILYKNIIDYIQPILCSFSDKLSKINICVKGFKDAEIVDRINGTGFSCGVDNLATIYRYLVQEDDVEYKLNALFMLNCGWHGKYGLKETMKVFEDRCAQNKEAAVDLGLPLYMVDSNLHAFLWNLDDQSSFFNLYTCIFALERVINKYYVSSSLSYGEIMEYGNKARNLDFSEYGDAMAIPLLNTKNLRLISDGCQYRRTQKTALIASWNIAKKYLNVCCIDDNSLNCSSCKKCIRTMLTLDALGVLDSYSEVFDIKKYKKIAYREKCKLVKYYGKEPLNTDNYNLWKEKKGRIPSKIESYIYLHWLKVKEMLKI